MSAYALPNLFPPVGKVDVNFCPWESFDHVTTAEEKTEHTPVIGLHHEPSSIRVTSARVDPVKLIQSLTDRRQSEIPLLRRKCRRGRLVRQNRYRYQATRTISPQEDAMQFILSIFHHSGRHYSISRTLTQIRQLHVALSKEVGRHGMSDNQISEYCSSSQNDCYRSRVLPELPAIHSDDCQQLGFSLLQDQLLSYSPSLEQWFQKVLDDHVLNALDGSPAFSDFLYEPVVDPSKVVLREELLLHQSIMLLHSKLYAIEESCVENDAEAEPVATEEADKIE